MAGPVSFDNILKPGWDEPLDGLIPHFAHFLQWVDEPQTDKPLLVNEEPVSRGYSEKELQEFRADQARMHANKKIYLVLDIDHTLLHCTRNKDSGVEAPSFIIGEEQWFFHFRPGLLTFLMEMHQYFEILLYTFSTRPYAEQLTNAIVSLIPEGHQLRFRTLLTRNECLDKNRKSLTELFPDQSMVLAIDDNKGAVWAEKDNLLKVPPYYFFGKKARASVDDYHLNSLSVFLQRLHRIFFEQKTCETRVILTKLRDLAVSICPLDMVAIEREWEKKRERRKEKARRKEEKARREAERTMAASIPSKAFIAAEAAAALATVLAPATATASSSARVGAGGGGLMMHVAAPPPVAAEASECRCSCKATKDHMELDNVAAMDAKRAGKWFQEMHSLLHPNARFKHLAMKDYHGKSTHHHSTIATTAAAAADTAVAVPADQAMVLPLSTTPSTTTTTSRHHSCAVMAPGRLLGGGSTPSQSHPASHLLEHLAISDSALPEEIQVSS